MIMLKQLTTCSSAISYKNRFLLNKLSPNDQLIGLFTNRGRKLYALRRVNYSYLCFLRLHHGLSVSAEFAECVNLKDKNVSEFSKLYDTYLLFRDLKRALMWRINESLPLVKAVCVNIKKKKQKKKKNSKKYSVEYKYVVSKHRVQLALRWLSLLAKIEDDNLFYGISTILPDFIISPTTSKFSLLKKKIYTGLLESR